MNAALEELCATGAALRDAVQRVIIGQEQVVEEALIALLCGGHVLIEGVPGLGKTLLVESLAKAINGQFHRVQFTPDLLPADITGSMIYDPGESRFKFRRGPVFTNLLLADEINRAPAKTQAALLEVMQERQVTIEGKTLPLAAPFMVLATQNPFEQEGTYHLPEAQLDRFLLNSRIDYPAEAQEKALLARLLGFDTPLANNTSAISPLLDAAALPALQIIIRGKGMGQMLALFRLFGRLCLCGIRIFAGDFLQQALQAGGIRVAQAKILRGRDGIAAVGLIF